MESNRKEQNTAGARHVFKKNMHTEKTLKNSMILLFGVAISTIGREPTQ